MFGRRNKSRNGGGDAELDIDRDLAESYDLESSDDELDQPDDTSVEFADQRPGRSRGVRLEGPFDVSELLDKHVGERVDLGGMWLPGIDGVELRMQVSSEDSSIESVAALVNDSAMELRPFAAPRNAGIWADVRGEIAAELATQGGASEVVDGAFGPELHARVSAAMPDGSPGVQPLRFIGIDGPRWFLRAVITGQAALISPEQAGDGPGIDEPLMAVLRGTVVLRGSSPMAPRDALELRLPPQAVVAGARADGADAAGGSDPRRGGGLAPDDLNPFERGPEITEIR